MSIPAIMIREEPTERRREERWRVCLGARWLDARPDTKAITVIEISVSGFLIKVERTLPVGTCLIVELPGDLSTICKIVWAGGDYHGACFAEPLSPGQLNSLLAPPPAITPVAKAEAYGLGALAQNDAFDDLDDADERLPFATSARLIAGATAIIWTLLGASLWLVRE